MRLAFLELFWARSDDEALARRTGRAAVARSRRTAVRRASHRSSQDAVHLDILRGDRRPCPPRTGRCTQPTASFPGQIPRQLWVPPSGGRATRAWPGPLRRDGTVGLGGPRPAHLHHGRARPACGPRPRPGRWSVRLDRRAGDRAGRRAPSASGGRVRRSTSLSPTPRPGSATEGQDLARRAGRPRAPARASRSLDAGRCATPTRCVILGPPSPVAWPEASPTGPLGPLHLADQPAAAARERQGPTRWSLGWRAVDKRFAERLDVERWPSWPPPGSRWKSWGGSSPAARATPSASAGRSQSSRLVLRACERVRTGRPPPSARTARAGCWPAWRSWTPQVTALVDQVAAELATGSCRR